MRFGGDRGLQRPLKAYFNSSVSDHFEVSSENAWFEFCFLLKVKGAGVAFNFGFGNRVLFGKIARTRQDRQFF